MMRLVIFGFGLLISASVAKKCPNGGEIFAEGISVNGKMNVVDLHNEYRLRVARGEVPGHPKGTNLKRIKYDDALGELAKKISAKCKLQSMEIKDHRYGEVGMNIYQMSTSSKIGTQNWTYPLESWFKGHSQYSFSKITDASEGGSYTQLVWATTFLVGCDYVYFYEPGAPKFPFTELYTCLYAPAGNIIGKLPYEVGTSGCENLC